MNSTQGNGTRVWSAEHVTGVVLAGGRNSRMGGVDKAFLTVEGRAVFERTLRVLQHCFPQVVVATNCPEKYQRFAVKVVQDEFPHQGPLAGMHAALGVVTTPYAFIVACDMPFLRPEPIAFLVQRIQQHDAIIPRWEGDIEPLHGVYRTQVRATMEHALRQGRGAVRDFLPQVSVEYVPEDVMRTVGGAEESFRNVNTPEDAARFAVQVQPYRDERADRTP